MTIRKAGTRARVVLAAIFIAALAANAAAADPLRIGKPQAQPFTLVPVDVGIEEGIFAKHGLTVEASVFPGGAKLHQGVAAGAVGAGPELAFVAKGAPEIGIADAVNQPALLTLITQKDGPVKTVADMKGRRVSVSTVSSLTAWLVKELARQQGWGPDGISLVELGTDQPQLAAMRTNQTSGMALDIATALKLSEEGSVRILVDFGDIVKNFHMHVIYASNKAIAERPDDVRAFLAAWFDTIVFMHDHKPETVRIGARVGLVSEEIEDKVYDEIMPTFSTDGKFDPKALAVLSRSFVELGTLDAEPDMTKLYTEKFLPSAAR